MKKLKPVFYSSFFILTSFFAYGQVVFSTIPMDSALVARNLTTNLGTINVKGAVNNNKTPYDSLCLKIYRGETLINTLYQGLSYSDNRAPFNFSFNIRAELTDYKIAVYGIKKASQILDTTINALVAGDVYIIEGQSNAYAMSRDKESANSNKNEFIRVFGNAGTSKAALSSNLKWFMAEGDGNIPENGHAGQWGLRLGRLLVDNLKIPVAIFNGAFGGTPISYYERPTDYKTSLESNYAREYYRLKVTRLQNNVRAIIWSQGETDATMKTTISTYKNEFDTLLKSWTEDYAGFKKVYIFQTSQAYDGAPLANVLNIEEAQREIATEHVPDIEIMSTCKLKADKGNWHFDYRGGYEEFGNRIYDLIARDLYGTTTKREIDAPTPTVAYFTDSTTIVVVEKTNVLIAHKDSILPKNIDTIVVNKNKIIYKLFQYPKKNTTVDLQYRNWPIWYANTNNIEALAFANYPVSDSISATAIRIKKTIVPYLKIHKKLFQRTSTVKVKTPGKHYLKVFDALGKKLEWFAFTGKHYKLYTNYMSAGSYSIHTFDADMNEIGTIILVVH